MSSTMFIKLGTLITSGFFLLPLAYAQSSGSEARLKSLEEKIQSLEKKQAGEVQALTDELARLKMHAAVPELPQNSYMGLGLSASKIYFSKSPLSIGGYSEINYLDPRGGGDNTTDMYRLVPYISYKFSDKLIFNSEIEFEHVGKLAVEFAYVDFLLTSHFNLRAGHVLVPIGIINLKHEPLYFPSVLRPEVERQLIPSTWHENAVLAFGELGTLRYHLGVLNGLKASKSGQKASSWIRGSRQWGNQAAAEAETYAYIARIDVLPHDGLELGATYYMGEGGQNDASVGDAKVNLWEIHGEWQARGLGLSALYTQGQLSDADLVSDINDVIGSKVDGYYLSLSYDWWARQGREQGLVSFVRYSEYDLHRQVPQGFSKDKALNKKIWTTGVNYLPHPQVVIKGDFDFRTNAAGEEDDIFALGLGLIF